MTTQYIRYPNPEFDISGSIIPTADGVYDIGSSSFRFRNLYLSGTAYFPTWNTGTSAATVTVNSINALGISTAGLFTIGPSGNSSLIHTINGRALTLSGAATGGQYFQIVNTGNTAATNEYAALFLQVGGATTVGDPYINFKINGVNDWSIGTDNSDSDIFKIINSATLGTAASIQCLTSGAVQIGVPSGTQNNTINGTFTSTISSDAAVDWTLQNTSSGTSNYPRFSIIANNRTLKLYVGNTSGGSTPIELNRAIINTDNNLTAGLSLYCTNATAGIRFFTGGNTTQTAEFDSAGNIVLGRDAIATNATDGFVYIPTCAGTPTGVPTSFTGKKAMVYDTSANKIWIYNGSWRSVAVT